jgi:hypothetical protein
VLEERVLRNELEGYSVYMTRVRISIDTPPLVTKMCSRQSKCPVKDNPGNNEGSITRARRQRCKFAEAEACGVLLGVVGTSVRLRISELVPAEHAQGA